MSDIEKIIAQNKANLLRMHNERNLRFDKRCHGISSETILADWVVYEIGTLQEAHDGKRISFSEGHFSQTIPESARHIVNIVTAQSMMPEEGTDYTSDIEFNAWRDAYRALGFSNLADLLESTRDIRPTFEKEKAGIETTDEEESRIQAVSDEICSHHREVEAARIAYTLKHRAELEAISPTIKEIFERYDRKAFGLDD